MRIYCLVCLFLIGCSHEQVYDLAITNVTLIDGTGSPAQPNTNVFIRDGRVATFSTGPFKGDAESIVDGTGRYLIPGLIDLHVHFPEDTSVHQAMLDRLTEFGVTTILNPGARPGAGVELRDQIAAGDRHGPRMQTAGRLIDDPPGGQQIGDWAARAPTPDAIRAEIREQAEQGVDFVKLYAGLNDELVAAAISESHGLGLPVIGHLEATNWSEAARLGIDMLVHSGWATPMDEIIELPESETLTDTEWYRAYAVATAGERFASLTEALVENDVIVIPTLAVQQASALGSDTTLFKHLLPGLAPEADVPGWWGEGWREQHPYYGFESEEEAEMMATVYVPAILNITRAYYERGIRLGIGTDVGNAWMTPGVSFHHEMLLYQDANIPPADIIPMATRNGAEALGLIDELGTLEIGKWADMVLLNQNPLDDIRNTRSIHSVFRGGQEQPRLTSNTPKTFDLVLANGRVMDPETGLDAIRHVGISDGTIQAVSETPLEGTDNIDATGLVVAPGFIDTNTHQHGNELFQLRAADGVTSVLNLEGGAVDINAYYNALQGKALIHYGASVAHGELRRIAQGDATLEMENGVADWPGINETRGMPELDYEGLTNAQKDSLVTLVERELQAGAVAIGFGIAYTPGATHSEILRMFDVAARYSAPSHIHLRDFDETREWDEMYEVLAGAIRWGGDLHIKHLQANYGSFTEHALAFIEKGRNHGLSITTECYPYTAASTFIDSALFDNWESWPDARFTRYEWPKTGERLTRETFARYRAEGGIIVIHPYDEDIQESAVRTCLRHPLPMIASDGAWDSGQTHPRVAGTNSRVLGRYVREEGILPLMDALRKMSLDPANHLSGRAPAMKRKGRIQVGADADIVVFDPDNVLDRATYSEPLLPPDGITTVLVYGVPVVQDGVIQPEVYPGQPIRGPISNQ